MKKIVTIIMLVVMLLSMPVNVMAADKDFVPSIENKGAPTIVGDDADGKKVIGHVVDSTKKELTTEHEDCLVITPVAEAETSKDIPEEAKKTLLDVYKTLKEKGVESIPGVDSNKVVRDLFDISSLCSDIDTHLPVAGNTIDLKFNLKVSKYTDVLGMVFVGGSWHKVPVVNNGDGTITATFEDFGAVAFLVDGSAVGTSPDTGDAFGNNLVLWVSIMVASLILVAILIVVLRRQNKSAR